MQARVYRCFSASYRKLSTTIIGSATITENLETERLHWQLNEALCMLELIAHLESLSVHKYKTVIRCIFTKCLLPTVIVKYTIVLNV